MPHILSMNFFLKHNCNGVFTPEQDNDNTTTRQMLNLCIPMMPFTPGLSDLVRKASYECTGSTIVLSLSCRCLAMV